MNPSWYSTGGWFIRSAEGNRTPSDPKRPTEAILAGIDRLRQHLRA